MMSAGRAAPAGSTQSREGGCWRTCHNPIRQTARQGGGIRLHHRGRRFFRTYDRSGGRTFFGHFRDLCRNCGKTLVVMGSAAQHRTKGVRNLVADHSDAVRVMHLPAWAPEPSAIGEYWHRAKRDILVSEYYATFEGMRRTSSECLRMSGPRLDITGYVGRALGHLKNF